MKAKISIFKGLFPIAARGSVSFPLVVRKGALSGPREHGEDTYRKNTPLLSLRRIKIPQSRPARRCQGGYPAEMGFIGRALRPVAGKGGGEIWWKKKDSTSIWVAFREGGGEKEQGPGED